MLDRNLQILVCCQAQIKEYTYLGDPPQKKEITTEICYFEVPVYSLLIWNSSGFPNLVKINIYYKIYNLIFEELKVINSTLQNTGASQSQYMK